MNDLPRITPVTPEPEIRVWPDGFYWHEITITSTHTELGARPCVQTTQGPPPVVAAYLRAVADQIDPPKPHTRAQQLARAVRDSGLVTEENIQP